MRSIKYHSLVALFVFSKNLKIKNYKKLIIMNKKLKIFALTLLAVVVVVGVMGVTRVSADKPAEEVAKYQISTSSVSVVNHTVNVAGVASATPFVGQKEHQYIQVDWGDGVIENSEAPSSVTFSMSSYSESKPKFFVGDWTGVHTYSTDGTYTIKAKVYHKNP